MYKRQAQAQIAALGSSGSAAAAEVAKLSTQNSQLTFELLGCRRLFAEGSAELAEHLKGSVSNGSAVAGEVRELRMEVAEHKARASDILAEYRSMEADLQPYVEDLVNNFKTIIANLEEETAS